MNLKSLSALIAVVGAFSMIQTADAKDHHWNQNGQNTAVTTGGSCASGVNSGQQGGWGQNGYNYPGQNKNGNGWHKGNNRYNNAWQNGSNGYNNAWQNGSNGYNNAWQNGNNRYNNAWQNGNNQNSNGLPWQFNGGNIDRTQAQLANRIQSGITSGKLTPQEAQRLNQMQARIDQMQVQFRSDSRLSTGERARLSSELSRLQGKLRKELSDRQTL